MSRVIPLLLAAVPFAGCEPSSPEQEIDPASVAAARSPARWTVEPGFEPLWFPGERYDGKYRSQLGRDGDVMNFRLYEGRGYIYTEHPFKDFTLRYEYRFPHAADLSDEEQRKCNTGLLVFITGEHTVWPRCLEVQGRWDDTAQIKSNARDVTVEATLDEPARDAARKPPGEWNAVEVVSEGGGLTVTLNGVEVSRSEPTELRGGPLGFQAEGYDVEFRNVRIRPTP